jgi:deferrochelatase/peroxidase EfeB
MRPAPGQEPAWCKLGTYCFVQAITLDMPTWDTTALATQEQTIGRFKGSGASLDLPDEDGQRNEPPAFAANPCPGNRGRGIARPEGQPSGSPR